MKQWRRLLGQHLPVIAVLCCGVLISALIFATLRSLETEKAKASFRQAAEERFDDLQSDLDLSVNKVIALGAFCESSYPVTRSGFSTFVTPLLVGHGPGIKALDWVPRTPLSARMAFEKSARANGLTGFEIREQKQGKMVRAGDRPEYFPVLYVEPIAGNQTAVGYDVFSTPIRREALMRAAASGELTATQRITLVQDTSDQYGILILHPVYSHGGNSSTRKQLLGFALGVLRVGTVVERHGAKSGVEIVLTDLNADAGERQLYPTRGKVPPAGEFTQNRTISVGGREWRITASPMPGAFPVSKTYSYGASVLCLLFDLLLAAYMMDSLGRRLQVERLVEERTSALNAAIQSLAKLHAGLEESEARYRRLVEDSPNGIVVERQGKIVLVNRAAAEMFDFDASKDSAEHQLVDFVVPERRENAKKIIQELYARDMQIASQETRLVRRDGAIMDVEIAASSFSHADSRNIQVLLHDISRRKLAEAENQRLIRAIEQVGESIVITDINANIVFVNPAFERLTGYSREEALGQNPRVLKSGRHNEQFYDALWDTLKAGESWSGHFINRAKNGRLFIEEATISPIVNRSGEITNYVAVKRDVTLENELREQLQQSQKMDAIGRLAGGVAHDFNNMLMVIVSYADLLAGELPAGDAAQKHIGQIMRAAERSSALIRQLLAFSRKQVLAPQILDCNAILTETSSMVSRLISENIELKCDLAPDLWKVKADADQIVQVILNLCVNSRDAMPRGGTLTLSTRNYHVDEGFVELSVSDTGVGIPVELQEKLFEPFFTTKERFKGTGLGLATVYGIVQQSRGSIRVESVPGRGATFRVLLPRCLEAAPASETPAQKRSIAGCGLVLVVEDEDALRQAIAEYLRNHNYQVLVAADGIEALDVLARNPGISVIVSDLVMPRMGGREFVQLASKKSPDLQVIFMSGYADQDFSVEAVAGSAVPLLQKPFSMSVLLTRIAELSQRPEGM